jgi:integrase
MRTINNLRPTLLDRLPPGLHHDGRGLYLQVSNKNGGRSWVLRYMINGKARTMGLGSVRDVPLAVARRKRDELRQRIAADDIDPIEVRRQQRQAAQVDAAKAVTFKDCAESYIKANEAGWRNAKHAGQWRATLASYAYPVFGDLPVQAIDTALVVKVLEPIWTTKTETATRVRMRIEAVLNWATVREFRAGDNPARWRGHLEGVLPKPSKVRKIKHFAAMPYAELPAFYRDLSRRKNTSAKAMAFAILNGGRSTETRLATVGEIDFRSAIWTIPGERTKSGREHRVPLSKEAMALLRGLNLDDDVDRLLFPNSVGKALSENAMRKYLQEEMGHVGMTVHGFRSTFKDWARERTNFEREVVEAALSHVIGDKTEAAYARGDVLDKRRKLMDAWAKYCASGAAIGGKVILLQKR